MIQPQRVFGILSKFQKTCSFFVANGGYNAYMVLPFNYVERMVYVIVSLKTTVVNNEPIIYINLFISLSYMNINCNHIL